MSEDRGDVIIVGAGLIGLSIAFELAERGAAVRVYDRGEPGHAASWAAAGILAPDTEHVSNESFFELCRDSLREYPAFVERVRGAGGVDPRLRLGGVVHAAFDERGMQRLDGVCGVAQTHGTAVERLDRKAMLALEPWLGASVVGGAIVRGEGCVDNRRLGRALTAACDARGVRLERSACVAVECDARRALGVRTDAGFVAAGIVVNACGAWAAQLAGVPPDCVPPVEPVKGQMLALAAPDGFVRHTTWVPGAYLVPRDDGRVLVGATVESAGFERRTTARGTHDLLHAALTAAPALESLTVTETWAGLRPGTPDGLPFLGPVPLDGLLLATGHFRNGVLLAPATARLIADFIETGTGAGLAPFLLERHAEQMGQGRIIPA